MNKIFLGLDVSKGFADCTIIDNNGTNLIKPMRLPDNNSGYNLLLKTVSGLKTDQELLCYAGMESTGGLETHWFNLLFNKKEIFDKAFVFNGYRTKHYQKALNERNKTDAVSSKVIAQYIRNNHENMLEAKPHLYHQYKKFLYTIKDYDVLKTKSINQLRQILYEFFPEFSSLMPDKFYDCHLRFLMAFPSRKAVLKAKKKTLMKIPYIKEDFVDRLVKLCKETILIAQPINDFAYVHIQKLARDIFNYKKDIDLYFEKLSQALPKEQIDLLCTIPGVGKQSAISLLILIGDVKNFDSGKKLSAYFGVHPVSNNSGNVEMSRMSKQGNPYARQILYQIVFQMFKQSSFFNPYFEKMIDKFQEKKKKAAGAMMQKVCRIIWSILTFNKPFDCERFKHDREMTAKSKEQTVDNTNLFFKDNNLKYEDWETSMPNKIKKKLIKAKKREPQDNKLSSTGSSRPSSKIENNETPKISQEFS